MAGKDYRSETLVIHWDAQRCIHTAICTSLLPGVFDVQRRPWVDVEGADTQAIVAAVERCPTGALRYHRLDGGPDEVGRQPTTVAPMRNGPLYVRGRIRVVGPGGEVLPEETRVALCRCGATGNPPFCDNSHRHVGYRSPDPEPPPPPGDAGPATPAEICEPQEF